MDRGRRFSNSATKLYYYLSLAGYIEVGLRNRREIESSILLEFNYFSCKQQAYWWGKGHTISLFGIGTNLVNCENQPAAIPRLNDSTRRRYTRSGQTNSLSLPVDEKKRVAAIPSQVLKLRKLVFDSSIVEDETPTIDESKKVRKPFCFCTEFRASPRKSSFSAALGSHCSICYCLFSCTACEGGVESGSFRHSMKSESQNL